jgi:hypothetical protein
LNDNISASHFILLSQKIRYNKIGNRLPARRIPTREPDMSGFVARRGIAATLAIAVTVSIAGFVPAGALLGQSSPTQYPNSPEGVRSSASPRPPSEAEIAVRAQKLVANQHRDDEALKQYERIERHADFTGEPNPHTIQDRTYRVVPTGSGTLKILLKDNGNPTDPSEYRRQLQAYKDLLELMLHTDDSRTKLAYEKFDKRNQQRAELVDSIVDTFTPKWLGRETKNGRPCDLFELDPKADFHPHSILQEALTHISAKIWVDRDSDELVRGEAQITRDISFGGGILGKVYRGGVFSMDQSEVSPGVWEPVRYQYDFGGRKFLFSFADHQVVEASQYRRLGPPKEALTFVQNELESPSLAP